jgi:spore germination cell wall hydrolase CwlJ-like protein
MRFDPPSWYMLNKAIMPWAFFLIITLSISVIVENRLQTSSRYKPFASISPQELHCMAANIHHIASDKSLTLKYAVAHVTLNRVKSSDGPSTLCDVLDQSADPSVDVSDIVWAESMRVAFSVIRGQQADITGGATHYYSTSLNSIPLDERYSLTAIIEDYSFYRKN